ncbi:unnamed protein product, partial [Timema podura]|nr:unnamed protein product [Timema podura]
MIPASRNSSMIEMMRKYVGPVRYFKQLSVYHCGSELGWSPVFWFKTRPAGHSWSPMLAVYGDLGNSYAESLTLLQKEAQRGLYDAFIHAGDFAEAREEGRVGDEFLRQIESIAGYVPYMTCPGNHEQA